MSCNNFPIELSRAAVAEPARKLNYFPVRHVVLKHCSLNMILHKENLDFKTHCAHCVGYFAQEYEDKILKNDNFPRVLDCIYLRSSGNRKEGHNLLNLQTRRVINRKKNTSVLMSG